MKKNQGLKLNRRRFLIKSGLASAATPFLPLTMNIKESLASKEDTSFEFVFMTDIHIKPEMNAPMGFQMAIDKTNAIKPDFVITGGDLVYDVMRGNFEKGDGLFKLYTDMAEGFQMPVYNCIGNHDLFAIYEESPEDTSHPDYKYGMWQRYFGDTYYAFDHKGWHFITLNSLDVTDNKRYKGSFHAEQLSWLQKHLQTIDTEKPIVVTTHIPMLCTFSQLNGKEGTRTVSNAYEVFNIFKDHNLKLVLQGHIHWKEYGFVNDRVHFLTGGSIAGNGWKGRRHHTKEGFMKIKVSGNDFSWEYIDHGWEAQRLKMGIGTE